MARRVKASKIPLDKKRRERERSPPRLDEFEGVHATRLPRITLHKASPFLCLSLSFFSISLFLLFILTIEHFSMPPIAEERETLRSSSFKANVGWLVYRWKEEETVSLFFLPPFFLLSSSSSSSSGSFKRHKRRLSL